MTGRERQAKYKAAHPERVKESRRVYRIVNQSEFRAAQREHERRRRLNTRAELIRAFGGKCAQCGFDDYRALHVDHVNGGGSKETVGVFKKNSVKYQRHVLTLISSGLYQLLCANCNQIKEWERKRASRV